MTALSGIYPGGRITAAAMRGIHPIAVIKNLDQSATSAGTAFNNDDALYLQVSENATYLFSSFISYDSDLGGSGGTGMNFQWLVPAGAALRFAITYLAVHLLVFTTEYAAAGQDSTTYDATETDGAGGSQSGTGAVTMRGTLVTSAAAGTLQFQWGNDVNSTPASTLTIHAGSTAALWRIA